MIYKLFELLNHVSDVILVTAACFELVLKYYFLTNSLAGIALRKALQNMNCHILKAIEPILILFQQKMDKILNLGLILLGYIIYRLVLQLKGKICLVNSNYK